MLRLSKTRIGADNFHMDVAPGFSIEQEGLALVAHNVGGKTYAKPSQGTATERFLGFSLSRATAVDRAVTVQEVVVPANAPYEIDTGLTLIAGQLQANVGTSPLDLVVVAPAAGEVQLVGTTRLLFNSAQAGATVTVHAAYTPSALQAVTLQGDGPIGGVPSVAAGVIGIIRSGNVYTDRYDVNAAFDSGTDDPAILKTGPNGTLTVGGAGADLSAHLELLEAPSVGSGFVGVRALG